MKFRKLRYILIFIPVLVMVVPLLWLFTTHAGLIFTLDTIKSFSNLSLEFAELKGALTSDITADQINYQDESVEINISKVSTNLRLFWLLDAELAFGDTRISKAQITLKEHTKPKETDQQPNILPIGISFDKTAIDTFVVIDATPVVELTRINAKDITIEDDITIEKLKFNFPGGQVKLAGKIDLTKKDVGIDLKADWQLTKTEKTPTLAGSTQLDGNLLILQSETKITQPLQASIKAVGLNILSDLSWSASIDSPSISLNQVDSSLQTQLNNTKVKLAGNKLSATVKGQTTISDPVYGRWESKVDGEFTSIYWKISSLEMKSLDSSASVQAQVKSSGELPYSSNTGLEVIANWEQLQWPLKGTADYFSDIGHGKVTGTFEDYLINLDGKFSYSNYRFDDIHIAGAGNKDKLQFASVSTNYLDGQWQGKSSFDWSKGFIWQASFKVNNSNPAVQWPELPGKLNGTVSAKGSHQDDGWLISGNIQNLSGSFRDYPVKGNSKFSVSDKEYSFKNVNVASGKNTVLGNIAISNYLSDSDTQIQADWKINANNLVQLFPQTTGSVTSKGKMHGQISAPTIDAILSAKDFRYLEYMINSGEIKAVANLQKNEKLQVSATLRNSKIKGAEIDKFSININGTTHAHKLSIDSNIDKKNSFNLKAESGYSNKSWNGKLTSIDIRTDRHGEWTLPSPTPFLLSNLQLDIDNICMALKDQQAVTCTDIKANQSLAAYELRSKIDKMPLSLFRAFMPEYVSTISGMLNGNISLSVQNDTIKEFSLSLKSDSGSLTHTMLNKTPETVSFRDLYIDGQKKRQDIFLAGNADLQKTGKASVKLTLPEFLSLSNFNSDQAIEGAINIDLKDLSPLLVFIPDVQSIDGETSSNFRISGTLGTPVLTGKSTLTARKITLPQIGLELKDTELTAHSLKSKELFFEGNTKSGDGQLFLKGNIPDYNAEKILIKLDVKGKQFLAVKTPEVEMELSPELLLILDNNTVNVDGKVGVDRAQITLLDTFTDLSPSSDVIIIDPQAEKTKENPLILKGKIRLVLSDRIFVQGSGFMGRITGELLIEESPGEVTRATGELIIKDGRYSSPIKGDNIPGLLFSIAQKELVIDQGKLIFASSPIDNPRVDIRARRPTSNVVSAGVDTKITVGVDIKGHVNSPQITLYSEPAMDQADILAYLTLGYPLTEASKNDGQYLARIASSIGLVGGEKLAKGIAKEFGIDEVFIQSENTTQQAQLVLGKYLSPKLYVRYAVGLGDAVDTLQIQYKLTDRWMLRTESAVTKQGTDLIYTIEKD